MKKRIAWLILALCMVLMCGLVAGCSNSVDTDVNKAIENTKNLNSIDAAMDMEMDMSANGVKISIPMSIGIKANGLNGKNPEVISSISVIMSGQSMDMEMYQKGDWLYMLAGGNGYKTSLDSTEMDYYYTEHISDMLQEIPKSLLSDALVKDGEGTSKITEVTVDGELFAEMYDDFSEYVVEAAGVVDPQVKISGANVKITTDGGYVTAYDMQFTMELTVDSESAQTDVSASVKYNAPGKKVKITAIEGYKDFEEIDTSGSGE